MEVIKTKDNTSPPTENPYFSNSKNTFSYKKVDGDEKLKKKEKQVHQQLVDRNTNYKVDYLEEITRFSDGQVKNALNYKDRINGVSYGSPSCRVGESFLCYDDLVLHELCPPINEKEFELSSCLPVVPNVINKNTGEICAASCMILYKNCNRFIDQGNTIVFFGEQTDEINQSTSEPLLTSSSLALANSANKKIPVKVIRASITNTIRDEDTNSINSAINNTYLPKNDTYRYDGLYVVSENFWFERKRNQFGEHKWIYIFKLVRLFGQVSLSSIISQQSTIFNNGSKRAQKEQSLSKKESTDIQPIGLKSNTNSTVNQLQAPNTFDNIKLPPISTALSSSPKSNQFEKDLRMYPQFYQDKEKTISPSSINFEPTSLIPQNIAQKRKQFYNNDNSHASNYTNETTPTLYSSQTNSYPNYNHYTSHNENITNNVHTNEQTYGKDNDYSSNQDNNAVNNLNLYHKEYVPQNEKIYNYHKPTYPKQRADQSSNSLAQNYSTPTPGQPSIHEPSLNTEMQNTKNHFKHGNLPQYHPNLYHNTHQNNAYHYNQYLFASHNNSNIQGLRIDKRMKMKKRRRIENMKKKSKREDQSAVSQFNHNQITELLSKLQKENNEFEEKVKSYNSQIESIEQKTIHNSSLTSQESQSLTSRNKEFYWNFNPSEKELVSASSKNTSQSNSI